jgi:hypothetical protein
VYYFKILYFLKGPRRFSVTLMEPKGWGGFGRDLYMKVLTQHSPGDTGKNSEKKRQSYLQSGGYSKRAFSMFYMRLHHYR